MFDKNLVWNNNVYNNYLDYLKSIKDSDDFKSFNNKLITTKDKMIGIRVPKLRKLAKEISKTNIVSFLNNVKNDYYEEILVEGFVIGSITNKELFNKHFLEYIKKIDNWATCDMVISSCKIMKKDNSYYNYACDFIKQKDAFIVRVGLVMMLDHYINDDYIDDILIRIDKINNDNYYVKMAIAWLISMCFVKYKEKTFNYLKKNNLDKFTYNKAIQKIIESLRVSAEDKKTLKEMKKK